MANVRWKDKTALGSSLDAADRMPVTDVTDTNTDKYVTLTDIAGVVVSIATGSATIWVPAIAMKARTTNGAAKGSAELTTGADIMIETWDFDTTTEEGVQFYITMPNGWNLGTVTAKFYHTNAGGSAAQTVDFGLSIGAFTDDDALDTTDQGTRITVEDTFTAQNDLNVSAYTGAITVGNTPADEDMLLCEITRDVASDDMTGDVKLLGCKILFTYDTLTDA